MINKLLSPLARLLTVAVLLAVVAAPPPAAAQETTNRTTLTRTAADSATLVATNIGTGVIVTNAATWTVPRSDNLAVQLILNGLGAGATNQCAALLQSSLDRTNYINDATLHLTGTGASTISCVSNLNAKARPYWRVRTITSTAAGTGTNLSVGIVYATKDGL
jgi:hypothetical protein